MHKWYLNASVKWRMWRRFTGRGIDCQLCLCCREADLASTGGNVTGRSQTLTHGTGPVERFHSVRKTLSYDNAATSANTSSSDSGLFTGDDVEIYSNWSSLRLSSIQDVTVSDEDLSSTSDHWVSLTVEFRSFYCFHSIYLFMFC